jgi:CRP/FNR family transcriptional regulator, cyclic AMP receptor protein
VPVQTNPDLAWLGHVAIALLIAAVLVRRERDRAMLVALAALLGVAVSVLVLDRLSLALMFALVVAAIGAKAALRAAGRANVRFSDEDRLLRDAHLAALDPALARQLIDAGHWIDGRKGDVLVEEMQAAPCLFFLASGHAQVSRDGVDVGRCGAGDLIGEATAVEGGAASGTVRLSTAARMWFIPAERLRLFLGDNPAARAVLAEGFTRALRTKLASANARAANSDNGASVTP